MKFKMWEIGQPEQILKGWRFLLQYCISPLLSLYLILANLAKGVFVRTAFNMAQVFKTFHFHHLFSVQQLNKVSWSKSNYNQLTLHSKINLSKTKPVGLGFLGSWVKTVSQDKNTFFVVIYQNNISSVIWP